MIVPKIVFCPKCHKPIKTRLNGSIEVAAKITIECGDKTCSGKVVLKPKKELV